MDYKGLDLWKGRCLSPSNAIGIRVTLGWFTFEPLKGPVALFDCIFANVRKPWLSHLLIVDLYYLHPRIPTKCGGH